MIPIQKIIAWFLIFLLSFEVIFRVPFIISDVSALESSDHEDIVSLLVEENLFRRMSTDIDAYARRIQSKLSHTRTVILTFSKDENPLLIASSNEKLYFSGLPDHGKKTQRLVGTILIGHVPIPVVHKDNRDFLSLFPYTDFVEPHFIWNGDTSRYEYFSKSKENPRAEIWHSVIDPNTGNLDTDAVRIRDFFTRVYEYDGQKGRYSDVGADPQVLYMDSVNESRAASRGLLSVYEQFFIPNQEHLLYNRFSREFSQYLYAGYLGLMKSEGATRISAFGNWKPETDTEVSFLNQASDITTKVFSDGLITPFVNVINEKYLGDVNSWLQNSGRYYNGSGDVRVDTIPELITTKDALSGQILKEGNDALEKLIDTYVESNLSLDIPILVSRPFQKTIIESEGRRQFTRTYNFVYDNYFYGAKASTLKTASDCSLIRGSTFGGNNTTVELNHGYNMLAAQEDQKIIAQDTDAGISCPLQTQTYWGGNSPLNIAYRDDSMALNSPRYDDFVLPILDPAAGKKTTGVNSPLDCLRNDLILSPYEHTGIANRKYLWPVETSGKRYSCATSLQSPTPDPFSLDPTPETQENILSSLVKCSVPDGNITLLDRDGKSLGLCQANGLSGTYKRISSLIKHSDPSTNIFGKQSQGISTPNLPIDEERYLSYLDRNASVVRLEYPNLYDVHIENSDTDEIIVSKIRAALSPSQSRLGKKEVLPAAHKWSQLVPESRIDSINIADVLLADPTIRAGIIDSLRWKNLDIESKYISVFHTSLSPKSQNDTVILPDKKNLYEISYLRGQGDARNFVFGFSPEKKSSLPEWFTSIENNQNIIPESPQFLTDVDSPYSLSALEISTLLGDNTTNPEEDSLPESSLPQKNDSKGDKKLPKLDCELLSTVIVWEWLSQILCWLQSIMETKSTTFTADTSDFPDFPFSTGGSGFSGILNTLKNFLKSDTNKNNVQDYVEKNRDSISLNNSLSARSLVPGETLTISTTLDENTSRLDDDSTNIRLEIIRIDDLDEKKSYSARDDDWKEIQKRYVNVAGSDGLRDGHASWSFSSQNNHRTRIIFVSRIYDGDNILLSSEQSSVLIGPIALRVTVVSSPDSTTSQTITAGDERGLEMVLSGLDVLPNSVDISIRDYVTGQEQGTYRAVPVSDNRVRLGSPAIDSVLRKAGKYTISVIAGEYSGQTHVIISPDIPKNVSLSLPTLLIRDTPQKASISLQDTWGNSIDIKNWTVEIKTSTRTKISPFSLQPNTVFSGKVTSSSIVITPLESGNTEFTLTLTQGTQNIVANISRPVLSDVRIVADIPRREALSVGQDIPVNFVIQRLDGTLVDTWDMPIKVGIRGGDAKFSEESLIFHGGKATTLLNTGTKPGSIFLYLSETGLGKIAGDSYEILPGIPHRIALSSPEILFAQRGARDVLTTRIYDLFGNLTSLQGNALVVVPDRNNVIESLVPPREISRGVYEMDIVSLGNPGRILFRAWLEKNGVKSPLLSLENVAETNALPVITSEEASKNRWQNLTQVLLGAAFGQTPVEGYFGGSTLFASETKTLAVTTLLDTPVNPIVTIMPSGNITLGSVEYGTGVIAQLESFGTNNLTVGISDTRTGRIARIHYPAMSDISFVPCPEECSRDTMTFAPAGSDIFYKDSSVYRNSEKLFSLSEVFSIPNLSFKFLANKSKTLQFSVFQNGVSLGVLSLQWKPRVPQLIGSTVSPDSITLQPLLSTLLSKLTWSNVSSYEMPGRVLYTSGSSTPYLGGSHDQGWSSYSDKTGLGWSKKNTSLLQFASGQEWSDSMKNHEDYLTINLGDPLIHLPEYAVDSATGFDKTLGAPLYIGSSEVHDFTFRDANNDNKKDIIVYHDNGTIGLRLGRGDSDFFDAGDLLSLGDSEKGMIRSGDFFGDGYADIVYVNTSGELHQIIHDADGPTKTAIKFDKTPIFGKVEQLEVFDMDHDSIDDIILMDHLGSLFVFYGHNSGIFRVQLIDNAYDFVLSDESKASFFTGAIRYNGPGFVDPSTQKNSSYELGLKQQQANDFLFTQVLLPSSQSETIMKAPDLGVVIDESFSGNSTNSLAGLPNGLLRMYDGDASSLANSVKSDYDAFDKKYDSKISVVSSPNQNYNELSFLRAPFIIPSFLSVKKQYKSLDESSQLLSGSQIEISIVLKNNSQQNISNILLLENFDRYVSLSKMQYSLNRDGGKEMRTFIIDSSIDSTGIADLRDVSISPGETIILVYTASLKSFTFGKFDVGYLEDSQDPTSLKDLSKSDIRTINSIASEKESVPESEFYNHDSFGDIRFNPNESCGGPVLLWRSHNIYDRTYHKTLITREVSDPDSNALRLSVDPTSTLDTTKSDSSPTQPGGSDTIVEDTQSALNAWQVDSDGDSIPNKDDNDYGEVFQMVLQNNVPQILMGLGSIDSVVAGITGSLGQILKGLGSGFGSCFSQPINWSPDMPGNTISALGHPVPKANVPPKACHKDVRCGVPEFAFPTGKKRNSVWPNTSYGAGGAFDYFGGGSVATEGNGLNDGTDTSGAVKGGKAGDYTPGLGISKFRLFLDKTLTGALTQLTCFGPNNAIENKPGMFPLRFDGNCIYAVQQLLQCLDNGSKDKPLERETDVGDSLPPAEEASKNPEMDEQTRFSNSTACSTVSMIDAYPSELSQATKDYFADGSDENTSALLQNIVENAPVVNGSSSSSALEFLSKYGADILKIAMSPQAMNFLKGIGSPEGINLKSVKAFPNFIMDWYHRQMDEVMSSLTQFPDLDLKLPDLATVADIGAIPGLSGAQEGLSGLSDIQGGGLLSSIVPQVNALPADSMRDRISRNMVGQINSQDDSSGGNPRIVSGGLSSFFESISQKTTVQTDMKRIDREIPYINGTDSAKRLKEYEAALKEPQSPENTSRLQENIERLKEQQQLPERLQELYYEKEKHLYGLSKNVKSTQEFMGNWMAKNGPKFHNWTESFVLNTKALGSWQKLIDVFNDYEKECGVNNNERWNLQHWLSSVIPTIIPNIPVIEMPRWPDVKLDLSNTDISVDAKIPDYNLTFKPISPPDAPRGTSAAPMELIPKIPKLSADIAPPSVDIPQLPDIPPAPKMPGLAPALKPALKIFDQVTKFQCLYRKVPLSPEWFAGTKVAHKTERKGYIPGMDFADTVHAFKEKYLDPHRFINDLNNITFRADRSVGSSGSELDTIESSLSDIENSYSSNDNTPVSDESIQQIPELIQELISATQNPVLVTPEEGLAQLSRVIQELDIGTERRAEFAQILDIHGYQHEPYNSLIVQLNTRFDTIDQAIQLDRIENKKIINDLIAWQNNTKKLEDIPAFAQSISGTPHLAQNSLTRSHLASLDPRILNPSLSRQASSLLSVTTTDEPTMTTTISSDMEEQGLTRTQGLYVTKGSATQKLIYFTDELSDSNKLHTVDDDADGDLDLYYSLGNIIYRKENHTNYPSKYTIKDAPKVYTTQDIYEDFFGLKKPDISLIPHDGQIALRQRNSPEEILYQFFVRKSEHLRLRLFRSLFDTSAQKSAYNVDIILKTKNDPDHPITGVPYIADIDGTVFLDHKKIYRTILPQSKYRDENGSLLDLTPGFTIRGGQYGYTSEKTIVQVSSNGDISNYRMDAGQRLRFGSDSSITVLKGSIILYSSDSEKRALSIRDTGHPLLPEDILITDKNGAVSLIFPDGQETIVGPSENWSLAEYAPGTGIKKFSLPVRAEWYYGILTDALSGVETRFPQATVFNAFEDFSEESLLSKIPSLIKLSLPSPSEIDFQSYFPSDTIDQVEILHLPSSQYRMISPTRVAFEIQKENTQIGVRVSAGGKIRNFETRIITDPPKLAINTLDKNGQISGKTFSVSPLLPLGIQLFIDNQSWNIARGFVSYNNVFTTNVVRTSPLISLKYGTEPLTTFNRISGVPVISSTSSMKPQIILGMPLSYSIQQGNSDILRITYQFPETVFRQVATFSEIEKPGIYVIGSGLRLETSTLSDILMGGAYITDTNYKPLITFDSHGIIRTLDTNISWSVKTMGDHVVYMISRDRVELGSIAIKGDTITTLQGL